MINSLSAFLPNAETRFFHFIKPAVFSKGIQHLPTRVDHVGGIFGSQVFMNE